MRDTQHPRQGHDLHYRDMDRYAALAAHHSEFGGRGELPKKHVAPSSDPGAALRRTVCAPPANALHPDEDLPDETPSSETVMFIVTVTLLCAGMAVGWYSFVMSSGSL